MNLPDDVFRKLKEWLRERQPKYIEHSSWNGCTEGGFYSLDEFDFELMCEQIDEFHRELTNKEAK